jgi:transcriptional regulator with XRE-family HTH domain
VLNVPSTDGRQSSPAILRWRLANELRRLRKAAGVTSAQVAERLCCSLSKISRIETGRVGVSPRDVSAVLQLYGVDGELRESLLLDAREARRREIWWHAYDGVLNVSTRTFIEYEKSAATISVFELLVIPGLLQTEDYARAITRVTFPSLRHPQIRQHVELRVARRRLLLGDDPPTLRVVLDEAALRRLADDRRIVRSQLQRLVEDAGRANVCFQLLPFGAGLHGGMTGPFTILDFADPAAPSLVHLEHSAGDVYLGTREDLAQYERLFARLQGAALSPDSSVAFLVEMASERDASHSDGKPAR